MSDYKAEGTNDAEQLRNLLRHLRTDFESLRVSHSPVKCRLIHWATNAEIEGVPRNPPSLNGIPVSGNAAGRREGSILLDAKGKPRFVETPVLDVKGKPITNAAGMPLDVVMPAHRSLQFWGDPDSIQRLQLLAEPAGKLVRGMFRRDRFRLLAELLAGWQFGKAKDLWWALVFELAWSERHLLLTATRHLWRIPSSSELILYPYGQQELKACAESGVRGVPSQWLERLPDAYLSDIEDFASASVYVFDVLEEETEEQDSGDLPTNTKVPPRAQKAWNEYEMAADALEKDKPTDREAYDLVVKTYAEERRRSGKDHRRPSFSTWIRNLRIARKVFNQQKHKRRSGRADDAGSVVNASDL